MLVLPGFLFFVKKGCAWWHTVGLTRQTSFLMVMTVIAYMQRYGQQNDHHHICGSLKISLPEPTIGCMAMRGKNMRTKPPMIYGDFMKLMKHIVNQHGREFFKLTGIIQNRLAGCTRPRQVESYTVKPLKTDIP